MIDSRSISDLHPTLQRGANELIRRMKEKGYILGITSTYRDIEKQNDLYAKGRTKPGSIVTNAKGGDSIHNYKLAFDIFENLPGHGYDNAEFFKTAGKIWEEMGGEWGGDWTSFVDTPHMQFTGGLTLRELKSGKQLPESTAMIWEEKKAIGTVEDAIERLAQYNIIATPDYWLNAAKYIVYLDSLLINVSNAVKKETTNKITDPLDAIKLLTDKKISLSPEYWTALIGKVRYFSELLLNISSHL